MKRGGNRDTAGRQPGAGGSATDPGKAGAAAPARRKLPLWLAPRRWRKRTRAAVAVACVLLAGLLINAPSVVELAYLYRLAPEVARLPAAPAFTADDRLLVIAPHPDDEVLACSGSILAALRAGGRVDIVWITCGDGFEWDELLLSHSPGLKPREMLDLGGQRASEARAAAVELGVPADNLYFLGYPDGGLARLARGNFDKPYRSHYTRQCAVPYGFARTPGSPYTGRELQHELGELVAQLDPTVVLAPAEADHHPDHRAAAQLVRQIFTARGELARVRTYVVHGGFEWPIPKGLHQRLPLSLPPRGRKLDWRRVELSADDEAAKRRALEHYETQLRALRAFLDAFVRTNELVALDAGK